MSGSAAGRDQEIEIKFRSDAAGLARLLDAPLLKSANDFQTKNLKATYFDTPSNALRKNGIILRIRKSADDAAVLGMKAPGTAGDGPFHRKEVEVKSPSMKPNLALFDKTTEKLLRRIIKGQPLGAKFKMEFKRQSGLVTSGSSVVEIAVDQGHISCGKRPVPLAEVELELVSGRKPDLLDLGKSLANEFSLRLDFVSKAEKGFRGLLEEKPVPVKATPIDSKALATFDGAVTAIISNALAQFTANWACLRETDEPEAIHQMRIGLRRMRCALSIFKKASPNTGFGTLRVEAGHLASAFGPVRNADAIRISVLQSPLASADCPPNSDVLRGVMEKRRIAAYASAHSEIESLAATLFVLNVQSLLARDDWREAEPEMPARKFFKTELSKLRDRVLKRAKTAGASDQARHKLRIALKNLRYAVDFFDLFGKGKRRKAYKKRMSALQDLLGMRNDIVVAKTYLKELMVETGPEAQQVLEFIRGWYARDANSADGEISKAIKKFKRMEPFWN
jgi:triphosphatase